MKGCLIFGCLALVIISCCSVCCFISLGVATSSGGPDIYYIQYPEEWFYCWKYPGACTPGP